MPAAKKPTTARSTAAQRSPSAAYDAGDVAPEVTERKQREPLAEDPRGYLGQDASDIIDAGNGKGTDGIDLHVDTRAIDVRGEPEDRDLPGGHVNDPTTHAVVGSEG